MPPEQTYWGVFPLKTQEEALKELELGVAEATPNSGSEQERRARIKECKTQFEAGDRKGAEKKFFGICWGMAKGWRNREKPSQEIAAIGNSRLLKHIAPEIGFILAIKSIREGDTELMAALVEGMKKDHPLHPDLLHHKTDDGESLMQLAARRDLPDLMLAMEALGKGSIESTNSKGETVGHTASRCCAEKTLEMLIRKHPGILVRYNAAGIRAIDLEGGAIIKRLTTLEAIRREDAKGKEKKSLGIKVIEEARDKEGKPLIWPSASRLKTERLPAREPEIT